MDGDPRGRAIGNAIVQSFLRVVMQAIVTAVILAVAAYAVLNPSVPPDAQKWATGIIGTITGFWFRER